MIKAAKAEALIRRVLAQTPPGLFQHMMRTINSQVGAQGAGRQHAAGWLGQRSLAALLALLTACGCCCRELCMPSTTATRAPSHPPTIQRLRTIHLPVHLQVLVLLDTRRTGYVDLALLIMCLLALW